MKKYLTYMITLAVILGFTACGGGDAAFEGTSVEVSIVTCDSGTIDTYTQLQSGDVIIKDEDNTTINTYHDIDGNKKICVDTGSAHIVR